MLIRRHSDDPRVMPSTAAAGMLSLRFLSAFLPVFIVPRTRPPQMRLRPSVGNRLPALATEVAFWSICATDGHATLGCRDVTGNPLGEVFRLELVEEGSMDAPPLEPQPNVWDQGRAELYMQQARVDTALSEARVDTALRAQSSPAASESSCAAPWNSFLCLVTRQQFRQSPG